jgi:CRP-like cAMP-binding protein
MAQSRNRLLDALPPSAFAALAPHLETVDLKFGAVVAETGREVDCVYFPYLAVVSLVVELSAGDMIETAMVGREGAVNATAALLGKLALHKAIVQIAGSAGCIDPDALRKVVNQNDFFRSLLVRHEQVLLAETQQSAACNASHSVEARMCRWLLRMRDLAQSDDLELSQEFLAQMLGVQRSSVSQVAGALQRSSIIRYSRGHIRILDVEALCSSACECYQTVKEHYNRALESESN